MKRSHEVEDAVDRAQKFRKQGTMRVDLDEIGFWPSNRGGLGVSSHHIHEVAWDCKANKTRLDRYSPVGLIEIPSDMLASIQEDNKRRCEADDLMPRLPAKLKYICSGKTHFCHAQKLAKDGGRTLFNQGKIPIRWGENDTEGHEIMMHGPICQIYGAELLRDTEAVHALSGDDNLNAKVQWGMDEMQAFGRVDELMERMNLVPGTPGIVDKLISALEVSGLGNFSVPEWKELIALRVTLSPGIAKVLQTCQFVACAGRVRVKTSDFGLAAKLDPRAQWSKVAVMLWQYMSNIDQRAVTPEGSTFSGRKEIISKKLSADVMKEIFAETEFQQTLDTFIKIMISTYSTTQVAGPNINNTPTTPTRM